METTLTTLSKIEKFFVKNNTEMEYLLIDDIKHHFGLTNPALVYEKLSKILHEVIRHVSSRNISLEFFVTEYEKSAHSGENQIIKIIENNLFLNLNLKEMPDGMISLYRFYYICKIYLENDNQDLFLAKLQNNQNQYRDLKLIVNRQKQIKGLF